MLYTQILNNNRDFLTLYRKGKFTASKNIVIYVRKNNMPFNRLGITTGKKIGNSVHRSRARRVIRQAYFENEILMPVGIDIVIVARPAVCSVKSTEISRYLRESGIAEINRLLFG